VVEYAESVNPLVNELGRLEADIIRRAWGRVDLDNDPAGQILQARLRYLADHEGMHIARARAIRRAEGKEGLIYPALEEQLAMLGSPDPWQSLQRIVGMLASDIIMRRENDALEMLRKLTGKTDIKDIVDAIDKLVKGSAEDLRKKAEDAYRTADEKWKSLYPAAAVLLLGMMHVPAGARRREGPEPATKLETIKELDALFARALAVIDERDARTLNEDVIPEMIWALRDSESAKDERSQLYPIYVTFKVPRAESRVGEHIDLMDKLLPFMADPDALDKEVYRIPLRKAIEYAKNLTGKILELNSEDIPMKDGIMDVEKIMAAPAPEAAPAAALPVAPQVSAPKAPSRIELPPGEPAVARHRDTTVTVYDGSVEIRDLATGRVVNVVGPAAAAEAPVPAAAPAEPQAADKRAAQDERKAVISQSAAEVVQNRADLVKVVVGVPYSDEHSDPIAVAKGINRALAKNGYGLIDSDPARGSYQYDENQIVVYFIHLKPEDTRKSYEQALAKAERMLATELKAGMKGQVVAFAHPNAALEGSHAGLTTVIADSYSDSNPAVNAYPDIVLRVLLARRISDYFNIEGAQLTPAEIESYQARVLSDINSLLAKVAEEEQDFKTMSDLIKKLQLRIKPVNFESFVEWKRWNEAVATSA
jgi:hypothetical protein